jgi:hypothetical protein
MPTHKRGPQGPSTPSPLRLNQKLRRAIGETEPEEFIQRLQNCSLVRGVIAQVLTDELERVILQSESPEVLDSPNALAVVADLHGYRRALRFARSLIQNSQDTTDA